MPTPENPPLVDTRRVLNEGYSYSEGAIFSEITLRDLFAAFAPGEFTLWTAEGLDLEATARLRYEYADSMLAERGKRKVS